MSAARTRLGGWRPSETTLALLGAYFLLVTLYAWQAWRRETPTIFTDELELTQISRAISEVGHPARRGEPYGFTTLAPWLTAPFWWISSVATAYEVVKYFQALVMALAIFPAFAMARTVVSRPWALFAAIGTIAAPALSYAPILVEEPFAYPIAVLALWLIVRAIEQPSLRTVGLAAAACVVGMLTRSQLIALATTLAVALLAVAWASPRMRRWRETWTSWDWVGAIAIAVGLVLAFSALMGHTSQEWAEITAFWKGRILEYGVWAFGAFAIGVGVIPAIALLGVLAVPRVERTRPGMRSFLLVSGTATASFCWYAAIKGAYLSTKFSSLIVERNLIYLTPLAFVATAVLLERARAPLWALIGGTAAVATAIIATPIYRGVDQFPYYEAHGLSILAFLNREWGWPVERIETAIVIVALAGGVLLLVTARLRSRPGQAGVTAAIGIAVAVLAWNLTNEIYAAIGEHDSSAAFEKGLAVPHDWIDRAVGEENVTILAQNARDGGNVWGNEFWNRSITQVWSVDGTHPPPGDGITPDLVSPDGVLWPAPNTRYVLQVNGVEVSGDEVARQGDNGPVLVRIGDTLKLKANQVGITGDGWMGANAAYNRFDVSQDGDSYAVVRLSRETFCPEGVELPGLVTVRIGPLGVNKEKEPSLASVTETGTVYVPACGRRPVVLKAPAGPWRIELEAETFKPSEVDPENTSDARDLGARVSFDVVPA
jgi:Dolichyl-phosphate-mannose-protein mannosyltransferase